MKDIKKDIEEIYLDFKKEFITSVDWVFEFSDQEFKSWLEKIITDYITENYQPKTTSTDIEELKKEFDEIYEGADSDIDTNLKTRKKLWELVLPHLSNKSELKKEAVREFVKFVSGYKDSEATLNYLANKFISLESEE